MQTLTTAKATEFASLPLTRQQVKLHLRIANDDLDEAVDLALRSAVEYCEAVTGRVLRVSYTVVQSHNRWPCAPVRFDWQPAYSISHVKYYDADNTLQTVSSSLYRLSQGNAASTLEFDQDFTYPALYSRSDAVQVTYLAGYSSVANIPPNALGSILLCIEKNWGDTAPADIPRIERALSATLSSIDIGAYR